VLFRQRGFKVSHFQLGYVTAILGGYMGEVQRRKEILGNNYGKEETISSEVKGILIFPKRKTIALSLSHTQILECVIDHLKERHDPVAEKNSIKHNMELIFDKKEQQVAEFKKFNEKCLYSDPESIVFISGKCEDFEIDEFGCRFDFSAFYSVCCNSDIAASEQIRKNTLFYQDIELKLDIWEDTQEYLFDLEDILGNEFYEKFSVDIKWVSDNENFISAEALSSETRGFTHTVFSEKTRSYSQEKVYSD